MFSMHIHLVSRKPPWKETHYGLKVSMPVPYDEAIVRATDALKAQGFGVLTTIDVKATLKAKLDRDFRKYLILGACNPPLADRALHAELEVGLLLPCNIIVYETSSSSAVVRGDGPACRIGCRRRQRSLGASCARGGRALTTGTQVARIGAGLTS